MALMWATPGEKRGCKTRPCFANHGSLYANEWPRRLRVAISIVDILSRIIRARGENEHA